MTKRLFMLCVAGVLCLTAGTAMAESIKNRAGVTGRIGFTVPSDSTEMATGTSGTNAEFIGGGGFIYGITDNFAGEFDITHFSEGEVDTTNLSFGFQYRFINVPVAHLVPYAGGGLDVLLNGVNGGTIDDVVGIHAAVGVDYFFRKDLAVTAELKGVLAPDADVTINGTPRGQYDPNNLAMTFGARYFFY